MGYLGLPSSSNIGDHSYLEYISFLLTRMFHKPAIHFMFRTQES
jgi:hypothetical protein